MYYFFVLTESIADLLAEKHFLLVQRKEALKLKLGKPFYFTEKTTVGNYAKLLIGTDIFSLGHYSYSWSTLPLNTQVGNYCSIAANVVKRWLEHPYQRFTTSAITYEKDYPPTNEDEEQLIKVSIPARDSTIKIGSDVWIGAYAMLKPGITIHTGSIVAARANVTKDVPPYTIVGGNPAKFIKMRFDETTAERLLATQWFDYDITRLPFSADIEINAFIDMFYEAKEKGKLHKLEDRRLIDLLTELDIPFFAK